MIGRAFAWFFLFAAGAVTVRDGLAWRDAELLKPATFSALLYDLSPTSIGVFRGQVLSTMPSLWNYLLAPFLSLWAGATMLLLAIVLMWTSRRGKRRRG
jgi:hypothetical protein